MRQPSEAPGRQHGSSGLNWSPNDNLVFQQVTAVDDDLLSGNKCPEVFTTDQSVAHLAKFMQGSSTRSHLPDEFAGYPLIIKRVRYGAVQAKVCRCELKNCNRLRFGAIRRCMPFDCPDWNRVLSEHPKHHCNKPASVARSIRAEQIGVLN